MSSSISFRCCACFPSSILPSSVLCPDAVPLFISQSVIVCMYWVKVQDCLFAIATSFLSFTTRLVYCFITFLWIPLLSLPPFFLSDDGSSIIFCSLVLRYSQRQLRFGFQACTLYWTSAGFQGILYRKLYMTREKQAIIFRLKKTIQMRSQLVIDVQLGVACERCYKQYIKCNVVKLQQRGWCICVDCSNAICLCLSLKFNT